MTRTRRLPLLLLALCFASCRDPVGLSRPLVGDSFALFTINGVPLPFAVNDRAVVAETMTLVAADDSAHTFQVRSVVETSEGTQTHERMQTFRVDADGVLRYPCPIFALCTYSVIEARLRGDALELTFVGGVEEPVYVYRRTGS